MVRGPQPCEVLKAWYRLLVTDGQAGGALVSQQSDIMTFFTWNVGKNVDALKLACQHLARCPGTWIASFQEPPTQVRDADVQAWSSGKLKLLTVSSNPAAVKRGPHVILLGSATMGVDPTRSHEVASTHDSERRMLGLSLFSQDGTWSNLQVLGVHGPDRINNPTDLERGHWGRCMRGTLDEFWTGGPLVVLGDLNANPFHDEITDRAGLHAVRKKDGIGEKRKLHQMEKYSVSLYNPMWSLLVDDRGKAQGTYRHSSRTRTDLLWHCIDQIIISAHLEPHLIGVPEIQTCLTGDAVTSLVNSDGVPLRSKGKPVYSDHLPVQLSIDIKKVDVCRTSAKP